MACRVSEMKRLKHDDKNGREREGEGQGGVDFLMGRWGFFLGCCMMFEFVSVGTLIIEGVDYEWDELLE